MKPWTTESCLTLEANSARQRRVAFVRDLNLLWGLNNCLYIILGVPHHYKYSIMGTPQNPIRIIRATILVSPCQQPETAVVAAGITESP